MRKIVVVSAALVLALALAGCGSNASSSAASSSTASSAAMSTSDVKSSSAAASTSSAAASASSAAVQTQASTQVNADGPNFDVAEFAKAHNLGEVTYFFLIPGLDGKEYWGICTLGTDGVTRVTHTDDTGNIIDEEAVPDDPQPTATTGYSATTGYTNTTYTANSTTANANDGADFDVAAVAAQNNLGQYTHYFWIQGSDGKDYWGICANGADGKESVTYTDAAGNIIQGGDVPTANGVVPTGPNQQ